MRRSNNKARQIEKKNKEDFLRERNTYSKNIKGLSELQENVINYLHLGCSMSFVARNIYGIHPDTLRNAVTSALFVKILDDVNEAEKTISYQYIINKLYDIIEHSVNENNQIKACIALAGLLPTLSEKEIADVLYDNSISVEDAEKLLTKLSNEEGENEDGKEKAN